jgi:hypothetical protein
MSRVVRSRLGCALIVAALASVATACPAWAGSARDQPAFDQYVPSLPSADGEGAVAGKGSRTPLPGALRERLARQPDGALLRAVAGSKALGAPDVEAPGRALRQPPLTTPSGDAGSAMWGAASSGAGVAMVIGLTIVLCAASTALVRGRLRRPRQ